MELDELKLHLKQKLDTNQPAKTQDEITVLLGKDTLSVLGKIKRSLWFEIIICIPLILACGAMALYLPYWSLRIYFSIFTCLMVLFLVLLGYLLRKVNSANSSPMPVKKNLEMVYRILKEFVKRYFQFTMALIPICMFFAIWLSAQDPDESLGSKGIRFSNNFTLGLFITAYTAALATGTYFFTKWYLKKLYGKYLLQLAGLLKELDE